MAATTTMIQQQQPLQHPTSSSSSRVRTVSVENIPKAELEASAAASAAAAAGGAAKVVVKKTSNNNNNKSTTTTAAINKKPNTKTSNSNSNININMKGKTFHLIHKPHPESKVGIDLIDKKKNKSGSVGVGVYVRSICPGCLAAKQTNLIAGLRVFQVNGINVETSEQGDLLIKTCDTQISIVTQSYKEIEAMPKKKKKKLHGFGLGPTGVGGVGLTLAAADNNKVATGGGIVVSKVNPKGLFPTLQVGQYVHSINGRSIRNAQLANKILKNSASLRLVVVEPDYDEEQEEATKAQPQNSSGSANYMDKYADDFVEGDYENFVIQSFDNDSSGTDGIASGEGGEKSSTVSTALMSSTVRSYSVTCEYELMDKIDIQMKDYDDYNDNGDGNGEVLDETDVSSVISEMTDNENETSNNSSSNNNNSNSSSSICRSRGGRRVVISVHKSSIDDVCGMKAKKNIDDGKIYITQVCPDGLFANHVHTLTGAAIEFINGVPCPTTTPEFVEELKQAYPRLVLECTTALPPSSSPSPSNKDSDDDNRNDQEGTQEDRPQQQQEQRRPSSTTMTNRRDMLLKEPSNFSCLDQHLEEILPENFDISKGGTNIQFVENSKVLAEATKVEITQKAGLRLRRSNPTNSVFISAISDDSLFVNSSLQVGMKILKINGKPCPPTTSETVQRIKDISGTLQIEAAMIDWDATLSDAWTAAAAAAAMAAAATTQGITKK